MRGRLARRLIASLGIAVLLFTQFAVAAYACSSISGVAGVLSAAASDEAMQMAMPGCEMNAHAGAQRDFNLNLCLQHCKAGDQSVQTLPGISVPPFAALPSFDLVEPVVLSPVAQPHLKTAWAVPVPLPPPLVRFGALRI